MKNIHSFHIPVMGLGFTIDSPIKVSQYGIDSVISLADDTLLEQLRKKYSEKYNIPFTEITQKTNDYRAKRITSYLDLMKRIAEMKFEDFKSTSLDTVEKIKKYFEMLPEASNAKQEFKKLTSKSFNLKSVKQWIKDNLSMGSIDVNIMTKVDGKNYVKNEPLPIEYNDAHAALRGFANSQLNSSIIFSAGMNPPLFAYIEQFDDFFPNENGEIEKKIILKVSDYRSALIQGTFLAKKGLWVSEYRIESGLNCGGHAFATDGYLLGPILEEFKTKKSDLHETVYEVLINALSTKDRVLPNKELDMRITTQGGVGTAEEHQFLLDHYNVDSVGWGSPFLLVPEATTVDEVTLNKLSLATEKDLYLSNISPLGVQFNNLKGNTKEIEKLKLVDKNKPGSPCLKKHLSFNTEFTEKSICTASSQYQKHKINELNAQALPPAEYEKKYNLIVEKECLCMGLSAPALMVNDINMKPIVTGVSVCPGPNMAYFSKIVGLKEMVNHIYGATNVISRTDRPNMFIKELKMYLDYLKNKIDETSQTITKKQEKLLVKMSRNMSDGINYYYDMFSSLGNTFKKEQGSILSEIKASTNYLQVLDKRIALLLSK